MMMMMMMIKLSHFSVLFFAVLSSEWHFLQLLPLPHNFGAQSNEVISHKF